MARHGYIRELSETDDEGRLWFTGVFTAEIDGPEGGGEFPGWEATIEWAEKRAEHLALDFEGERRFMARGTGGVPEDDPTFSPALPAELEAELRRGRRRPLGDRWLDRTEDDAPVEWEAAIAIEPDLIGVDIVEPAGVLAQRLAGALREGGFSPVEWTDEGLRRFVRENEGSGGWVFSGTLGVEVTARAVASTHRLVARQAVEVVRRVLDAENHRMPHRMPDDEHRPAWNGRVDVHPPGYEPPFGSSYFGEGTVDVPPDSRR